MNRGCLSTQLQDVCMDTLACVCVCVFFCEYISVCVCVGGDVSIQSDSTMSIFAQYSET